MQSIPDIFNKMGGPSKVATLIGVKPSAASEMKRRKSIPVCYWPQLVDACREAGIRGVNYDFLVEVHQKKVAA